MQITGIVEKVVNCKQSSFLAQCITGHGRFGSYASALNITDPEFPRTCDCSHMVEETSPDHVLQCRYTLHIRRRFFPVLYRDPFHTLTWAEVLSAEGDTIRSFLDGLAAHPKSRPYFVFSPRSF